MIIDCNKCHKKFDIESGMIPDKGRLLLCSNCNHKWFFKKKILKSTVSSIDDKSINIFDQNNTSNHIEIAPLDTPRNEVDNNIDEEFNEKIEISTKTESEKNIEAKIKEDTLVKSKPKKKRKFKILNIIIVLIISFLAFIIILDTFKNPIGQVVPNIEFLLYNLYESIKDVSLFIKDLK